MQEKWLVLELLILCRTVETWFRFFGGTHHPALKVRKNIRPYIQSVGKYFCDIGWKKGFMFRIVFAHPTKSLIIQSLHYDFADMNQSDMASIPSGYYPTGVPVETLQNVR